MKHPLWARTIPAVLGMLLTIGGAFAMIQTIPNDQLIAGSELIAVASLKKSTETGTDEKGFAQVENILTVHETLKGEAKPGDEILVDTIGGGFEDEVVFKPRRQMLVFLVPGAAGRYQVNNFVQGAWPVDPDGKLHGMGEGETLETVKKTIEHLKTNPPAPASDTRGDAL